MQRILITVLIFLSLQTFVNADQKNLDYLFQKLKKENNQNIARSIEDKIWELWTTHNSDNSLTQMMNYGTILMNNRNYDEANRIFTKIIMKILIGLKDGIKELQSIIIKKNMNYHKLILIR